MSKDEQYIAQGKARDALKQKKSEVATLTTELRQYSKDLAEMSQALDKFLDNPVATIPDYLGPSSSKMVPIAENIKFQTIAIVGNLPRLFRPN